VANALEFPKMSVPAIRSTSGSSNLPRRQGNRLGWQRLGLTQKAVALAIALGTAPVILTGFTAYHFANQQFTQEISRTKTALAVGMEDKVKRFMGERYADIQVLAALPSVANPAVRDKIPPSEKQASLNQYVEAYKIYDSIAIFDLKGNVIAQSQGDPLGNHSDRVYFQEVLKTNQPVISSPEVSQSSGKFVIHFAAPIRDSVTGKTIGVVRSRMPLTALEQLVKNFGTGGDEFYLMESGAGTVFLANEKNKENKDAQVVFPELAKLQKVGKPNASIIHDATNDKEELLYAYAPFSKLEGMPDLKWEAAIATPTELAFASQRRLLLILTIGTVLTALLVSAIAVYLARRATRPILAASEAVEKLGHGQLNTRLAVEGEDELAVLGSNINLMASQLQTSLHQQAAETLRAQRFNEMTTRIRESVKVEDVYNAVTMGAREILKTDRAVVYLFDENWQGTIVAESVDPSWPKSLGANIADPCFADQYVEKYKRGRVKAIENIYEAGLSSCYLGQLEPFKVKANLVAPILAHNTLHGLLVTHQCSSTRSWQESDINLFKQIAIQVGQALDRMNYLTQVEQARQKAEGLAQEQRQQKEALQIQLLELLSDIEGAARGDLTVRAEVSAGEIGTVADFFNSVVESLRGIVTQVKKAAAQVNTSLGENEGAIRQLSSEALKQAEETTRTLDSLQAMTSSIQEVAENARQAAFVARRASTTAVTGGVAMDRTVENIFSLRETVADAAKKVKRLGESSQKISKVASLIEQIALQTNLLAINAGIEAARAGEQGHGFAVVAEEVGELAARSAEATQEIELIVDSIRKETAEVVEAMEVGTSQVVEGTHLVEDAKQSLSEVLEVSRQIDALVQSISNATVSQAQTSQSVTELMKEIAKVSERTSTSTRNVSGSLKETVEIAQELQASVSTFNVGTEG
jgi:twitching motility protein PilJ